MPIDDELLNKVTWRIPNALALIGSAAGGTGMRYFTMWVANLDEIVARAEAANATIAMQTDAIPGIKMAMIEDPDGNWLEFVQQD